MTSHVTIMKILLQLTKAGLTTMSVFTFGDSSNCDGLRSRHGVVSSTDQHNRK
jgi:hypothetical protein